MKANITLSEALRRASRPLARKIEYSVGLLRKAERLALAYDNENGYFLAFSGGKDSQALYHVAELAGVKFKANMNLTSVDPPQVIRFVRMNYPEVTMIKPKDSIYNIAVKKGLLPTMRVRWCCAEYKENAGAGKVTLIGIRHEESTRRKNRNEVEISSRKFSGDLDGLDEYRKAYFEKHPKKEKSVNITNATEERTIGCIHGKESILISPIIEWTMRDVWEFLNDVMQVPHCELYDMGWRRIGCLGCPMSSLRQKRIENEMFPHVRRNWIKAIKAIRNGGYYATRLLPPQKNDYKKNDYKARHRSDRQFSEIVEQARKQRTVGGFSSCSSPDGLTDEQEQEIAENIYDWWISGKPYQQWYADKFIHGQLDF